MPSSLRTAFISLPKYYIVLIMFNFDMVNNVG